MVINRDKHNIFSARPELSVYTTGATTSPVLTSGVSGGTTVSGGGGTSGSGLTDELLAKLNGIEEGAQVNQNAFAKVTITDGSTSAELVAVDPSDNLTIQALSPISISLVNGVIQLSYTAPESETYWLVDDDGNLYTTRNVYSTGEISAYGYNSGTGSGGTGGTSYLYDLKDVDPEVQNAEDGSILQYDADQGLWVASTSLDLTGYMTKAEWEAFVAGADPNYDTLLEISNTLDDHTTAIENLDTRVVKLEDMFEWDGDRIKAKASLWSVGEIAAYGYDTEEITGAVYLSDLKDVTIDNLTEGNLLQWNGTEWVNIDKSEVGLNETELSNYLSNISITTGDGLTGGGTINSSFTLDLAKVNAAGTYYKVTTDNYGRVTSGSSELTIGDIVNLLTELNSKLNIIDFNKVFIVNYNEDGSIESIQANADFYSIGEVSAFGKGSSEDGASSATTLGGLYNVTDDADLTSDEAKIIVKDPQSYEWTLMNLSDIGLNEAELAQYLSNNGYINDSNISNYNFIVEGDILETGTNINGTSTTVIKKDILPLPEVGKGLKVEESVLNLAIDETNLNFTDNDKLTITTIDGGVFID